MTFPPPQSSPSSPTLSSDSFQPQFEFEAGGGSSLAAPKPLESLHESPVPPFLSKTYDLVDDPALDCIISWGNRGNSFVVWEPLDFARMILPQYFKHNNFSSFVRQLNTYVGNRLIITGSSRGFRKIDTDKWEFANEGFLRRQKHLLKTIQRRRAHQFQQFGSSSGSSNEAALEDEIKALRKERRLMMEEVVDLQNQQCGTVQYIEAVNEKLEAAERGQKQMVSFLAKMLENPRFLARISQLREQKSITSPRTKRKFVKHQTSELGTSTKGEIVMYQPELCITSEVPYQVEDCEDGELAMVNELLHVPEKGELVLKEETIDLDLLAEQNVDVNNIPDFSIGTTESMVMEEARSVGLEAGGGRVSSSTFEPWGYFSNYNLPDLGIEEWLDEDYTDY